MLCLSSSGGTLRTRGPRVTFVPANIATFYHGARAQGHAWQVEAPP
jgi:hypothetical protein